MCNSGEEEPGLDFDFLMLTIVRKEPTPESLRSAAARGNVKFLTETLTKWPEMVYTCVKCLAFFGRTERRC